MMPEIAVLDYGLGNLRSVVKGLERAGAKPVITKNETEIETAEGILLPGVGAFAEGMDKLSPLIPLLKKQTKPVLGICLGMQMLLEESEEFGIHKGLGFIEGKVRCFPKKEGYKIPQMGWNTIHPTEHPLFEGIPDGSYVYFVHSYYADTTKEMTLATTDYIVNYASAVGNKNIMGTQFHPEKSGETGLKILENFVGLCE